ncbi:hypothetical protein B5X24_HaOG214289 [Helicoverpa armigera]|nr:hypothetical protein B5X24_HaOG214289 [Helicoverpa armigera]
MGKIQWGHNDSLQKTIGPRRSGIQRKYCLPDQSMDATGSWTQHRLKMPQRESPRSNHTGSRSGSRSRRLGEQERSASQQRSAPHCHDGHQDVNQEQQPSRRRIVTV